LPVRKADLDGRRGVDDGSGDVGRELGSFRARQEGDRHVGGRLGGAGSRDSGERAAGQRATGAALDATRARLESWGIPKDGIQIVDGSGLSRRNVVAPDTLLAILLRAYEPSGSSPFMRGLPVAGRDGTLASRMKGTAAEGNVVAKTGTLSNVRTLAGYVKTADGEPLAFVIMVNNFEGTAADAVAAIDRMAARLASFSRR